MWSGADARAPAPAPCYMFEARTFPPLSVHAFALFSSVKPLPLQLFWALQALSAPAQLPFPLHSLTPAHFTTFAPSFVFSGLSAARAAPAANSEQTALAMTAPFITSRIISSFLSW